MKPPGGICFRVLYLFAGRARQADFGQALSEVIALWNSEANADCQGCPIVRGHQSLLAVAMTGAMYLILALFLAALYLEGGIAGCDGDGDAASRLKKRVKLCRDEV